MSWDQLLSITKEAKEAARIEASQPLVACPDCGTPLVSNDKGKQACPFDGWSPFIQPRKTAELEE